MNITWDTDNYTENIKHFKKIDGIKAIMAYVLIMASAFFQGWIYTTDLSTFVLSTSQIWISLVLIVVFIVYLIASKEHLSSIGIHTENIYQSVKMGFVGGIVMLVLQAVMFMIQGASSVSVHPPVLLSWGIFVICAFEEEIVFRGYIQTRLAGLITTRWVAAAVNAVLFLSIHYPVRWVVSGHFSLLELSVVYVIMLLALHYFCDAVYRKTNCLWGAVILHIIYNAVGTMVIFY